MARPTPRKLFRFLISTSGVAANPFGSFSSGTWMFTLASHRSAAFLHLAVGHAQLAEQQPHLVQVGDGLLRAAQVRVADDLQQRGAGAVEVHPGVAAAAGLVVLVLAGVLLQVRPDDADALGRVPLLGVRVDVDFEVAVGR